MVGVRSVCYERPHNKVLQDQTPLDESRQSGAFPCHLGGETVGCHMIRVLDSAGSTLVEWGRQQQQQQQQQVSVTGGVFLFARLMW